MYTKFLRNTYAHVITAGCRTVFGAERRVPLELAHDLQTVRRKSWKSLKNVLQHEYSINDVVVTA